MVLSAEAAHQLASEWRVKFVESASFEESWSRFFAMNGDLSQTRLEAWLAKDLERDHVKNAGVIREPVLPTSQHLEFSDCGACRGYRYVRFDVPIGDQNFGKAHPCPRCNR